VREIDAHDHTVLMVQVENEVGVLNDSRDRSPLAEAEFAKPVPRGIDEPLLAHRNRSHPNSRASGRPTLESTGTWAEVFGPTKPKDRSDLGPAGGATQDRVAEAALAGRRDFHAWHYSRYVNRVAAAGKREYNIPMVCRTPGCNSPAAPFPSHYPSAVPVPQVIGRVAGWRSKPRLLAPDLYVPEFAELCERFYAFG